MSGTENLNEAGRPDSNPLSAMEQRRCDMTYQWAHARHLADPARDEPVPEAWCVTPARGFYVTDDHAAELRTNVEATINTLVARRAPR